MAEQASSSIDTRSSTAKTGCLEGFSKTPTITTSKVALVRPMMSRWPFVTGSNVPGQRAVRPMKPPGTR